MNRRRTNREHDRPPATRRGLPIAWALLCWLASGNPVCGVDDRVEDVVAPGAAQLPALRDGSWVELGPNLDRNLFQQTEGLSVTSGRRRAEVEAAVEPEDSPALADLRTRGLLRVERIDAICDLSDRQRRALELAVEADARRIADEIEAERRKYRDVGVDLRNQEDQKRFQQFQQDVLRCRGLLHSPFDHRSLLVQSLETTLDDGQRERFAADADARRDALWRGLVAAAMLKMDSLLGLDERQYGAIEALLLERRPPLRVEALTTRQNSRAGQMLGLVLLAEIDGDRLRSIVSERQMVLLARLTEQGRSMRATLVAQGLFEERP